MEIHGLLHQPNALKAVVGLHFGTAFCRALACAWRRLLRSARRLARSVARLPWPDLHGPTCMVRPAWPALHGPRPKKWPPCCTGRHVAVARSQQSLRRSPLGLHDPILNRALWFTPLPARLVPRMRHRGQQSLAVTRQAVAALDRRIAYGDRWRQGG